MATTEKISTKSVLRVLNRLGKEYPDSSTELTYDSPFQLLIAVILSAQCTDERVNQTTPALFKKYPTAKELSKAKHKDVEKLIHSCGFYRAKAKSIISAATDIQEKFKGKIPNTMEDLVGLAGVGRKTASVVLNQAFGLPAIAVDTHVKRVSHRLGWAHHPNPEKIEFELRELIPKDRWAEINGTLILHGRRICKARKPQCDTCFIQSDCQFYQKEASKA